MTLQDNLPQFGQLVVEYIATKLVIPDSRNARRHNKKQIAKLAKIIRSLGWSNPIIIDEQNLILCGHARYEAALLLKLEFVPCLRLGHLSPTQKLQLAISDNSLTDQSDFDESKLRVLLIELVELEADLELTALDLGEIEFVIDGPAGMTGADPADAIDPALANLPLASRLGDLWQLGKHRLLCGSALEASAYQLVLGDELAGMIFTDPPYNVPVSGHVSGLGRHRHPEFAMASGEMSTDQFRDFLRAFMAHLVAFSIDGAIHFLCIDWRSVRTMLEAGDRIYTELKNICIWEKSNAGMGSLYRSQYELVVVQKSGTAPHRNNVELGKHGRTRSNIWKYPGANSFGGTRDSDLAVHSTVKPIGLVADAIRDCSKRGSIILDPFIGSGTTILAAERTQRRAAGIEIEPRYVDVAIRRWEQETGRQAILDGDGRTFAEIARERLADEKTDTSDEEGGQ